MKLYGYFGLMFGLMSIFAGIAVHAAAYLSDVPGTVLEFTGEVKAGEDNKPAVQTTKVLEPYIDKETNEQYIVHEVTISLDSNSDTKIQYFHVKPDGIYLVGEAKKATDPVEKLKTPSMVLPLPVTDTSTWVVDRDEGKKKVNLSYKVVSTTESLQVGAQTLPVIHIQGTGTSKVMGMEIPMVRDTWFNQEKGIVKQVIKQTIASAETTTTLTLTPSGTPPQSGGSDEKKSDGQSPQNSDTDKEKSGHSAP